VDHGAGVVGDLGGAQGGGREDRSVGDGDEVEEAALGLAEAGDADLEELVEGDLGGGAGAVGDEAGEVVEELRAALGLGGELAEAGGGGVGPSTASARARSRRGRAGRARGPGRRGRARRDMS
jgi:hypothetical protein